MKSVDRREKRSANAKGDESLGDFISDEAGLTDAGEEDGTLSVEQSPREGQSLSPVEVLEEVVQMALLRFEEADEGILVNLRLFFLR